MGETPTERLTSLMRRSLLAASTAATALTAALSLALNTPAAAGAGPGHEPEPWVKRSAVMRAHPKDFRSLCRRQKDGVPETRTFPLFGHSRGFTAMEDFKRQDADGTVFWSGHDPKHPDNTISVSVIGACAAGPVTLSGEIEAGDTQYVYKPLAKRPGRYLLQEIDALKLPPSGQGTDTVTVPPTRSVGPHRPGLRVATPDNPAAIDIVVAYTPATVTELGSVSAVQSRIRYGVNQLNRALATSHVPASVHAVSTYETQATGVARENAGTLLSMISNPANPTLGVTAAAQRTAFGADLVALIAAIPPEDSSGQANLPNPAGTGTSNNAFSVTSAFSITAWENLAHEIGHNFGLMHDRKTVLAQGGTTPANTYNYGWVTADQRHHTIMAYSSACTQPCTVVNQYSNTVNLLNGQALGDENNNNAAVATTAAEFLAGYRTSLATNRVSLTMASSPVAGGMLQPSEYGPYDPGTQVTVTAEANPGFQFSGWQVDGVLQTDTTPNYTITMNANHTITALFTEIPEPAR
ncbi:reprolysin-like metallopeptidase [Streptomyces sp. NPDC021080]|uniref:InlB B-repeat-containing protein n=1 Tax=Streptomyces sp. NPDC021080 TaxID=3365110 RepID=UPI0037ADD678